MYYNQVDVIRVDQYNLQAEKVLGSNSCFCIIDIIEGDCPIIINDKSFTSHKDDLFVLCPSSSLLVKAPKQKDTRLIQIMFYLSSQKMISDIKECRFVNKLPGNLTRPIVMKILSDAIRKPPFYTDSINLSTANLILEIIKNNANKSNSDLYRGFHYIPELNPSLDILIDYINSNIDKSITIKMLSDCINTSPATVNKLFKDELNTTPIQYINTTRINLAKELMMTTNLNITEIAMQTGFKSVYYFSRYFKEKEGTTPIEYKSRFNKNISVDLERKAVYTA